MNTHTNCIKNASLRTGKTITVTKVSFLGQNISVSKEAFGQVLVPGPNAEGES